MGRISMATRNELVTAVAGRCARASRLERSQILDEFAAVMGLHRKHAVRPLRGGQPGKASGPRPGRRLYDGAAREALVVIWEVSDRMLREARGRAGGKARRRTAPFDGGSGELPGVLHGRSSSASRASSAAMRANAAPQLPDQRQQGSDRRVLLGMVQPAKIDVGPHADVELAAHDRVNRRSNRSRRRWHTKPAATQVSNCEERALRHRVRQTPRFDNPRLQEERLSDGQKALYGTPNTFDLKITHVPAISLSAAHDAAYRPLQCQDIAAQRPSQAWPSSRVRPYVLSGASRTPNHPGS